MKITGFQHQCVRDLAWVMSSPSLLAQGQSPYRGDKIEDTWCQQIYQQNLDWLAQLDANPGPLQQWLAQHESSLLGLYFEALLAFWLIHLPDKELLAQNLVVGQAGQQVGEFDLLFRNKASGQVVHWEVAVKFYLRYGKKDYLWPGPNPRDTLQAKLGKVFERQLHLHKDPQAQRVLQAAIGTTDIRPQAFIKGYLFYPHDSDWARPTQIPAGVAENHLKGWWCRHADMNQFAGQPSHEQRWRVLSRLEWLAPFSTESGEGLLDTAALLEYMDDYFRGHYKALLLVELRVSETGWCEVTRGFVVNDSWPA